MRNYCGSGVCKICHFFAFFPFLGSENLARTLSKLPFLRGVQKTRKTKKGGFPGTQKVMQI